MLSYKIYVFGGVPCCFVGHGGVEVGTAAEKESRKGDEGKGLKHSPCVLQPLPRLLATEEVVEHSYHIARQHDRAPHKEHVEHGLGHKDAEHAQHEGDRQYE